MELSRPATQDEQDQDDQDDKEDKEDQAAEQGRRRSQRFHALATRALDAKARAGPPRGDGSARPGLPSVLPCAGYPLSAFFRTWLGLKVSTRRALIVIS